MKSEKQTFKELAKDCPICHHLYSSKNKITIDYRSNKTLLKANRVSQNKRQLEQKKEERMLGIPRYGHGFHPKRGRTINGKNWVSWA